MPVERRKAARGGGLWRSGECGEFDEAAAGLVAGLLLNVEPEALDAARSAGVVLQLVVNAEFRKRNSDLLLERLVAAVTVPVDLADHDIRQFDDEVFDLLFAVVLATGDCSVLDMLTGDAI